MLKLIKRLVICVGLITIIGTVFGAIVYFNRQEISDTVKSHALNENEIYEIKSSEDYQTIFANSELYPKRLLEAYRIILQLKQQHSVECLRWKKSKNIRCLYNGIQDGDILTMGQVILEYRVVAQPVFLWWFIVLQEMNR